jgi:hypothetical protein
MIHGVHTFGSGSMRFCMGLSENGRTPPNALSVCPKVADQLHSVKKRLQGSHVIFFIGHVSKLGTQFWKWWYIRYIFKMARMIWKISERYLKVFFLSYHFGVFICFSIVQFRSVCWFVFFRDHGRSTIVQSPRWCLHCIIILITSLHHYSIMQKYWFKFISIILIYIPNWRCDMMWSCSWTWS